MQASVFNRDQLRGFLALRGLVDGCIDILQHPAYDHGSADRKVLVECVVREK